MCGGGGGEGDDKGEGKENDNSFEIRINKIDGTVYIIKYYKPVYIYTIKLDLSKELTIHTDPISLLNSDNICCSDEYLITSPIELTLVIRSTLFYFLNNKIKDNEFILEDTYEDNFKICDLIFNFEQSIKLLIKSIYIENVTKITIVNYYRFDKTCSASNLTHNEFITCEIYNSVLQICHDTKYDLRKLGEIRLELETIFNISTYEGDIIEVTDNLIRIKLLSKLQLFLLEKNKLSKILDNTPEHIMTSLAPKIDCKNLTKFSKLEKVLKKIIV